MLSDFSMNLSKFSVLKHQGAINLTDIVQLIINLITKWIWENSKIVFNVSYQQSRGQVLAQVNKIC